VEGRFLKAFEESTMTTTAFGEAFMKAFREGPEKTAVETEHDGQANQGDPVRLTSMNDADPDHPDLMPRSPPSGLGARGPDPDPREGLRQTFAGPPGFTSWWDLRQTAPVPGDLWRTMVNPENNILRDQMLRPAEGVDAMLRPNGDAPPPSAPMRKAAASASAAMTAAHSGPNYKMLRPNP
jgi:hypothetical protein